MKSVTEEMIEPLRPCPFCGSEAECIFVTGMAYDWWARCTNADCRAQFRVRATNSRNDDPQRAKAISLWNRRAALEAALSASPAAQTVRREVRPDRVLVRDEKTGEAMAVERPRYDLDELLKGHDPATNHGEVWSEPAAPAAQTEDWVLVPREPTEAMLQELRNVVRITPETYALILAAAPSAPQPTEPVAVKIKPLEWREFEYVNSPTAYEAQWLGGFYQVRHWGGSWRWRPGAFDGAKLYGGGLGDFASAEAAKAAAQADYNARILSALASPVAQQRDGGWFDMSIAPKNGTCIVVQMPDGPVEAYWYGTPEYGSWQSLAGQTIYPLRGWQYASVLSPERKDRQRDEPNEAKPLQLSPLHLRLLRRGERGGYIGLADDAAMYGAESAALNELRRAGLVEHAKGPFPPGPPDLPPCVITEAGRAALSPERKDQSNG